MQKKKIFFNTWWHLVSVSDFRLQQKPSTLSSTIQKIFQLNLVPVCSFVSEKKIEM